MRDVRDGERGTYAEKEPLEIGGHLEDGAVRYFSDGRERRRGWLKGTMQVTNTAKHPATSSRVSARGP